MSYLACAFYRFTSIENPEIEIKKHKDFFKNRDFKGRIYISEEGINAQTSGEETAVKEYMDWIREDPRFEDQYFHLQPCLEHIFPRMIVKYRKEIVALGEKMDVPKLTGTHVSPSQWREMLEKEEDKVIIDVRNDYEWKIGHFENAELPDLAKFRDFPTYAEDLKTKIDANNTKVMLYCTGGIRCEIYSALLKTKGFKKVYQLQGGIIRIGGENSLCLMIAWPFPLMEKRAK
jgi:UPF0176 protein